MMKTFASPNEIIGNRFGKLVVLEIKRKFNDNRTLNFSNTIAYCKCDCGIEVAVNIVQLKKGHKKSCGCLKKSIGEREKTHGYSRHPLYWVFQSMKTRCYNSKHNKYNLYGGKGVKICEEWLNNPDEFIEWALEKGWKEGLQIDKDIIPKMLGIPGLLYSPEMCSIVAQRENTNNRNNTIFITYKNETLPLTDWAIKSGISSATIYHRLKRNWPIENILDPSIFKYRTKNILNK